jgi:hypothetical protein
MHLPHRIAKQYIMDGVTHEDADRLGFAIASTEDFALIHTACGVLAGRFFNHCLARAADPYGDNESFVAHMSRLWTALGATQLDQAPLPAPPWDALRLYRAHARGGGVEHRVLERAADMILRGMSHAAVDFGAIDGLHGETLLMFAVAQCPCGEMVLDRLFACGCAFDGGEICSGAALAAVIRAPLAGLQAIHQLSLLDRMRGCANARINVAEGGGTALHLACREVPAPHLFGYLRALVTGLRVDPALLNDEFRAPHEILKEERFAGASAEDLEALHACVEFLRDTIDQAPRAPPRVARSLFL